MSLTGFLPRVVLLLLLIQLPIWVIADFLAPGLGGFVYEPIAQKVFSDLSLERNRKQKHCNDLAQTYDLSWVYLADKNKKISFSSRPQGLPSVEPESNKVLEVKGTRHVEISRTLPAGASLAVGFCCPSLFDSLNQENVWPAQLPLSTVCIAFFLNLLTLTLSYLFCLGIPLQRTVFRLARGDDPPENFPLYVASELKQITQGLRERFANMQQIHEKNIAAARSDLSGAFAKEVEDRFVNKLIKSMLDLDNYDELNNLLVRKIADEFIGVIKAAFVVHVMPTGQALVVNQWGLSDEQGQTLAALPSSQFMVLLKKMARPVFLGGDELADKKLEKLVNDLACDQIFIFPTEHEGRSRTSICFLISNKDTQAVNKLEKLLEKVSDQVSPIWNLIFNYQNASYLSRHDYLTGLGNRLLLDEEFRADKYRLSDEGKTEVSILVFEGDGFRLLLNSYGPLTIDKLIQEFSQELIVSLEKSVRYKPSKSKIKFAQHIYRVGACKFLLILKSTGSKKAVELAESVCQMISERKDWAHGLPSWSASCGVASFLPGEKLPEDCFEEAMVSLDYVRSRKSIGLVAHASEVPEEFMSKAQARSLGPAARMAPAAILQEMEKSKKTCILTASSFGGKVFWAYIENGRPAKARLGRLCGDYALVEFIASFSECSQKIQDIASLDTQASADLRSLGGAYLVRTALSELIDLSINFRDSAADAKVHLKTPDMIIHPTQDRSSVQIEQVFFKAGKTPHKLYLEVANQFWDLCNGRLSLDEILQRLDPEFPASIAWTAADFLMQNKLIKFSRLRVSVHTDPERDATVAAQKSGAAPGGSASAPKSSSGAVTANYVSIAKACPRCHTSDPLSQKFCVHCGTEIIQD